MKKLSKIAKAKLKSVELKTSDVLIKPIEKPIKKPFDKIKRPEDFESQRI